MAGPPVRVREKTPSIVVEQVDVRYPGAHALRDVSLAIASGSVHALCGENGAGKSTLGKVIAGLQAPDSGVLLLDGAPVEFRSSRGALLARIAMVHQELSFCDNLSVAENLCLSALPSRMAFVDRQAMEARALGYLAMVGTTLDVHGRFGALSIGQRQMVQIAGAVGGGARVVVFDEPTSSLSQVEAERLYALIRKLKADGVTCIYVSHRMPEIFGLCDTVTVLRDGAHVATKSTQDLTEAELVSLMIGRNIEKANCRRSSATGAPVLATENFSSPGKFSNITFTLHKGEVLGIAGLMGAGRSELAAAIFGLDDRVTGTLKLDDVPLKVSRPADAIAHGIALVPEDRKMLGLVLSESCLHNTSLPILGELSHGTWVNRGKELGVVNDLFERLRIKAPSVSAKVASLSGGNQQKVVLARWLAARPRVLILDEPTRGVDVGAKAEIHSLIDSLADSGTAILVISSELPELLRLADRILILREGELAGEIPGDEATQDSLMRLMSGVAEHRIAS